MEKSTGVVEKVFSKKINTRFGEKDVFTMIIGGKFYGLGFKKPAIGVGDAVTFDLERKNSGGREFLEAKNVLVTASGTGSGVSTSSTSTARPFKKFPIPADDDRQSIIRQNALARATEIVLAMADAKDKKYSEDNQTEIVSRIIQVAQGLAQFTSGEMDANIREARENEDNPFEG